MSLSSIPVRRLSSALAKGKQPSPLPLDLPSCSCASSSHTQRRQFASSSSSPAAASPRHSSRSSSSSSTNPRSSLIRPVRLIPPRASLVPSSSAQKSSERRSPAHAIEHAHRARSVALLYALEAPPPLSALSALGNRISTALLGSEEMLKKLEIACTCPSFWQVVREQESRQAATGTQEDKTYTNFLDATREDNESLSVLGNHLLGVFALEWLESRYPNLPERVTKAALTLYVGPRTCADIASRSWGLTPGQASRAAFLSEDSPSALSPPWKPGQPLRGQGEGNRAGSGVLRWGKPAPSPAMALREMQRHERSEKDDGRTPLPLEEALASATRAIVGLIFQEHGFAACRAFVHAQFLTTRTADLSSLLKFPDPKHHLSTTLARSGRERAASRILAETGRLSIAPVFVVGVYSGPQKLGEGFGSSLQMAEWRAHEDALRRIYLAGPQPRRDSQAGAQEEEDGRVVLPSDTLVDPSRRYQPRVEMADDEILLQSRGRSTYANSPR